MGTGGRGSGLALVLVIGPFVLKRARGASGFFSHHLWQVSLEFWDCGLNITRTLHGPSFLDYDDNWGAKYIGEKSRLPPSFLPEVAPVLCAPSEAILFTPSDCQLLLFSSSIPDEDLGRGTMPQDPQSPIIPTMGDPDDTSRLIPQRASKRLANMSKTSILHKAMARKAGLCDGGDRSINGKSVTKIIAKSRLCGVTLTESEATKFAELLVDRV